MTIATLEQVKAYLGVSDGRNDDRLQEVIDSVESFITDYTGREWSPTPASDDDDEVARVLTYNTGAQFIDCVPYEPRSVSSVIIDPDGTSPYVLTDTQFMLEPFTAVDGVYDRITLQDGVSYQRAGFTRVPVVVTGRWGWAAVPDYVRDWLYQIVEQRFREDLAPYADVDGSIVTPEVGNTTHGASVPFLIKREMDRKRRTYIGGV